MHAVSVHPGGIRTNIARNARYHADPRATLRTHAQAAQDFDTIARTTPEKAAEIIHLGVKSGKSRVLVGRDAYVLDALVRLAPTRYADVVAGFIALERAPARLSVSVFRPNAWVKSRRPGKVPAMSSSMLSGSRSGGRAWWPSSAPR